MQYAYGLTSNLSSIREAGRASIRGEGRQGSHEQVERGKFGRVWPSSAKSLDLLSSSAMEDLDAELARALQEEEYAQARQHASADQRASIFSQLQGCMDKVVKCEDELLQAMALSCMPLDDLHAQARAGEGPWNPGCGCEATLNITVPRTVALTVLNT